MKEYYVYAHRKATTGEIFYIGKGTGRRAWGTIDRNPFWQAVARKHGFTIEIIEDQLQEGQWEKAFSDFIRMNP